MATAVTRSAALLAAAWLTVDPARRQPRLADAWLPLAAIALASGVALRADRTLMALDILGSLVLTGASVAAIGGLRIVDRPLLGLAVLALRVLGATAPRASWQTATWTAGSPARS